MKNLISILTLICFTSQTFASETVLLVSPLVKLNERDLPRTLDKNLKTFSEYYISNFPKQRNIESLLNEFENAQKYYLVKSYDLARQYYEKVVAFSDVDEWKDIHRKIIFLSFLRLAELNPAEQNKWILNALTFSQEIDPKKLDVSKEILKTTTELKKRFVKGSIAWQVGFLKSDFTYILINGHVIDLKKVEVIKIPSGKFRVTFLSDVYKPQTYQLSSQQIPLLTPTRIPFVSGSCEKPYFNNEGEVSSEIALYYDKNCIKQFNGKTWISKNESLAPDLNPTFSKPQLVSRTEYNEEPFYKKKWFLVTLGFVVVGAAAYAMNSNKKEKPTHETVNGL